MQLLKSLTSLTARMVFSPPIEREFEEHIGVYLALDRVSDDVRSTVYGGPWERTFHREATEDRFTPDMDPLGYVFQKPIAARAPGYVLGDQVINEDRLVHLEGRLSELSVGTVFNWHGIAKVGESPPEWKANNHPALQVLLLGRVTPRSSMYGTVLWDTNNDRTGMQITFNDLTFLSDANLDAIKVHSPEESRALVTGYLN